MRSASTSSACAVFAQGGGGGPGGGQTGWTAGVKASFSTPEIRWACSEWLLGKDGVSGPSISGMISG